MADAPLESSSVYIEHGDRTALLKRDLKRELSPSEPLRSNIKRIGHGSKGDDYVLIQMHGFTDGMAERLSMFVEGWHISPRASEYTGVDVYAEVDYDD